ncbi:MAG: hypothetical protein J1F31_00635 [Erysipelotrichales bacterium]|nr:hypothetical protein [Erysipelotrichales bacterium]
MKKYFTYLLKKNLLPLTFLTLFCIIVYVIPIWNQNYSFWNDNYFTYFAEHGFYPYLDLHYSKISLALGLIAVFIPILVFSYKMNKRSVDMHYSLPLSKTKVLISHFLVGLVLMYGAYTIAYLLGFLTIALNVRHIHLIYYLWLYLASLIPAFILYSVTAFVYTRANTRKDGIISVIGAICLFALVYSLVDNLASSNFPNANLAFGEGSLFPFRVLYVVSEKLGDAIKNGKVEYWFSSTSKTVILDDAFILIGAILWTLLSAGATAGLILMEKKSKAENVGQISESIFCYKLQIPAYTTILIATVLTIGGGMFIFFLIIFMAFIMTIVYRRTIKIGNKEAIILCSSIMASVIIYSIVYLIGKELYPPEEIDSSTVSMIKNCLF